MCVCVCLFLIHTNTHTSVGSQKHMKFHFHNFTLNSTLTLHLDYKRKPPLYIALTMFFIYISLGVLPLHLDDVKRWTDLNFEGVEDFLNKLSDENFHKIMSDSSIHFVAHCLRSCNRIDT